MGDKSRTTAIDIIGDVPWDTHFCQFYQTKKDLIDILVPYFKAGLENNEFCMWITSEPLNSEDAKRALKKKVKNLDDRIKKGQIEILDYTQWYTKTGRFNANGVLQGWIDKEKQALEKGFEGLRLSGNTFWLDQNNWKRFTDYEAAVNSVIGQHRMLAICTYSLEKCTPSEIVDVVSNHEFVLIRRAGKWEIIESAEYKKTNEALQRSETNYRTIFDAANDAIFVYDTGSGKILSVNRKTCEMFGYTREEMEQFTVEDISAGVPPYDQEHAVRWIKKAVKEGSQLFEWIAKHKTGKEFWIEVNLKLAVIEDQKSILAIVRDITERKESEEALQRSEERYALAQRAANIGSWDWDIKTGALAWSEQIEPMFGFGRGEFGATYAAFLESVHPDDRQYVVDSVNACVEEGQNYAIEHRIVWPDGTIRWLSETGDVVRDEDDKAIRMLGIVQDITDRKERESQQQLVDLVLERLNQKGSLLDLIRDVIKLIKDSTGFEAVGVRLREDEDFPYFEVNGFSNDFVETENYLCARNKQGEQIYDEEGEPVLSCMCGRVIIGRTDPALPFFTEGGSFWTNSTTEIQNSSDLESFQTSLRNHCNKAGYESVALVPLRSGDETVGLLQLNDSRPGRFKLETVRFFEGIGASIGIALARIKAEENIHNLAKFPSENPNPVLRIAKEGEVLYANAAGSELLKTWKCTVGEQAP
jgi:PAS domain S-box-containing protein